MTDDQAPPDGRPAAAPEPQRPDYKGAPLDADRGTGLGCFWIQLVAFAILFVLTPIGVINGWPAAVTTAMLIITLVLLLFVGQTVIFLLRLVAADRRTRRRPLRDGARPTVGDLSVPEGAEQPADDAARATDGSDAHGDHGGGGTPVVRQ
ncbi:MAG: hypothetical protein ACHQ02_02930 [Candidatus Limnocylindrales bacterium]